MQKICPNLKCIYNIKWSSTFDLSQSHPATQTKEKKSVAVIYLTATKTKQNKQEKNTTQNKQESSHIYV